MSRFEPRWLESLSKLELPIQLLWGDADAVSPMSIPQTLAKLINPDYLSFTIFPDTGTQITEKLQSATLNLEIKKVKKHIKSYPGLLFCTILEQDLNYCLIVIYLLKQVSIFFLMSQMDLSNEIIRY